MLLEHKDVPTTEQLQWDFPFVAVGPVRVPSRLAITLAIGLILIHYLVTLRAITFPIP